MQLVAQWWNRQRDRATRRDIWLSTDGHTWYVRARNGATNTEVNYNFTREYEARAMVDRLISAAPREWQDITSLLSRRGATADLTDTSGGDGVD